MKLLVFILSLVFSVSVRASAPAEADFSKINFTGLQVLSASGDNAFPWAVKPMVNGWEDLLKKLEEVSSTKIVSPIFYLAEKTSFKNIFVFVGKDSDGNFQFVNIYYTMAGQMYGSNMKVMNVEHDRLDVAQGIPNEQPKDYYKVVAKKLFPF
ncbi:hypothetical protein B9G69_012960 [Bdellovibrio sp. SKB1291214]|uniref:hypothetical protein n=1 Tax=Bdellovibrio sp. SKB1291214 TaxID=1732569 RepID=UPI000B515FF9|nr:hypothetical protein [Bdellovibrio sp. SKB1291214]UYL07957.1 hypothetical protein B9G69_012960 [Bdellovibrio sp. SKB1291214]